MAVMMMMTKSHSNYPNAFRSIMQSDMGEAAVLLLSYILDFWLPPPPIFFFFFFFFGSSSPFPTSSSSSSSSSFLPSCFCKRSRPLMADVRCTRFFRRNVAAGRLKTTTTTKTRIKQPVKTLFLFNGHHDEANATSR